DPHLLGAGQLLLHLHASSVDVRAGDRRINLKRGSAKGDTERLESKSGLGPWRGQHQGFQPADQRRLVDARAEAGLGCRPAIATSSEQRRLDATRSCDAGGGLEALQQMAKGHPAVELAGEDLLAQYPAHKRADRTQPFANVEQHTGFKTKALTD